MAVTKSCRSGTVSRRVLGTTVIGGMLAATFIAIFLIPVTFYFVEKITTEKRRKAAAASGEPVSAE